ncbi:D-alanyl-D-alanine carboxypeptidase/D-alanyl-D-alanine-endopeptidase (penicillin-binding protein 4) [Algoriphagus boseongensis]|uniref:D-alanyl-D-alanine carboxypeptidase/D-alanyl-D-alanine-endopeptidase (Penicillin-binding protein 4) n=1 Tax=Algoriphagus boseongensis TaxID=1442587 RepID=A0A4R6T9N6_9BACT|nr:D-alanyl-D-alanine carboxypeptidase [Algoriphagus boseongensis]TDQ19496.1 D-alanyl-D-alanine carboxypeptidase/D-alanyl-D-alanine-endopeptidase (penicillin-binding protein 4) [Algoriphagus boseongensis]
MKKFSLWVIVLALSSCTVQKINSQLKKSEVFSQGHMGFMLQDPGKEKTLVEINADKYFIPASNTKIFTFYTSYSILGDGLVNGLNYLERGDSLIFWGTGDPSLLHPDLKNDRAIEFLKASNKNLYLLDNFNQVSAFGPGWSWDWYPYYYAAERSSFPIFGNIVRFKKDAGEQIFSVYPNRFKSDLESIPQFGSYPFSFSRKENSNRFPYFLSEQAKENAFEVDIPFITSAELTEKLLEEASGKPITLIQSSKYLLEEPKKLLSAPADSIYAQMMKISDNFLAEQLLLLVSDQLNNSISTADAIEYAKENLLKDLPDEPIWVDGSGLSARNMFTPRSIIALLGKIREEVPLEKIKAYFPAGGESGTIRNWYKADEGQPPYIYAKTGSLSMTTALSGYLLTKSGKILHFSCLLNNYQIPTNDLRTELQKVLYFIHDRY